MRNCIIPFCKNRGSVPGVSYFRITNKRRDSWLPAIRRENDNISTNASICSMHFKEEDFEIKKNGKVLKSCAIPSVNLRPVVHKSLFVTKMIPEHSELCLDQDGCHPFKIPSGKNLNNKHKTRHQNGQVQETDNSDTSSTRSTSSDSNHIIDNIQKRKRLQLTSSDSDGLTGSPKRRRATMRMMHNYNQSPRKLSKAVAELKKENQQLKYDLRTKKMKIDKLMKKVDHLHEITTDLKNLQLVSDSASDVLEKTYSGIPDEIMKRRMQNISVKESTGNNTTIEYSKEIKDFAMTLQFYSSKAYNYVRQTFDLALPSPSSIRNWLTNVECLPGFTEHSFISLKMQVEKDKSMGKATICSLMLDEMSIKKEIEFIANRMWGYVDCGTGTQDDELAYAKDALVLMVVALNDHWKLPIAYFLIHSLTGPEKANIVNEALVKLHEIGDTIVSVTCDGPSAHFTMAKTLGAKIDDLDNVCSSFKHPSSVDKVHIIFDVCHMLKLLRNAWATLGVFIDEDGGRIDYQYIKNLHDLQEDVMLRFGNKLKAAHIKWTQQKMKVNLAAQLFSNSVADALEFLMTDAKLPQFQGAGPTIKFLKLIDRVFDLLNSRNPFGRGCKAPLRKSNIKYWKPILVQGLNFFKSVKDVKKNLMVRTNRKTAFVGFIIDITSVIGIFDSYVAIDVPVLNYLLTYKLSQDHLELFFCAIRSRNGWNNNTTPFQFYSTYRRLLSHAQIRNESGNCLRQDSTEILQVQSKYRTSKKTEEMNLKLEDISFFKKYDLPIENINDEDNENDFDTDILQFCNSSSILIENIVAHVAGFVIRMVKKKIKCNDCIFALENACASFMDDTCMLLINRKTEGGLIKPSKDVFKICLYAEKKIRIMLNANSSCLPREKNFFNSFILQLSNELLSPGKLFSELEDHNASETSLTEESHIAVLVKLILRCYCRIRWYHIAKRQTESIRGKLIRKKLSKLILFQNQ